MRKKRVLTEEQKKKGTKRISDKRRDLKLQAIEYKGGKCERCGYNTCPGVLHFHHIDPSQKDFSISTYKSKIFENFKPELDKCILLCSNCHAEIHEELLNNKNA